MKFKRVLLKLSGESLMGNQGYGIDPAILQQYAEEVLIALKEGIQIAIVVGGGNIFRGMQGTAKGFDRVQGDYMGMLATIMNSLALQGTFQQNGIGCKVLSGIDINPLCEKMSSQRAIEYLEEGKVVFIAGGTGNPYFTTDTAAALRAIEIKANVVLKGTRVDGVYDSDPEKNPGAIKYESIPLKEAFDKGLKIMDLTAFSLCIENKMPLIVFNMNKPNNLLKVVKGENIGTFVSVN